jgi:hypothetical protein
MVPLEGMFSFVRRVAPLTPILATPHIEASGGVLARHDVVPHFPGASPGRGEAQHAKSPVL